MDTIAAYYWSTSDLSQLAWSRDWQPPETVRHSSHELDELSQRHCHDESTLNIVVCIAVMLLQLLILLTTILCCVALYRSARSWFVLLYCGMSYGTRASKRRRDCTLESATSRACSLCLNLCIRWWKPDLRRSKKLPSARYYCDI